jgi:VCBS repeat-containing protein
MDFSSVTIRGQKFEVKVNENSGEFSAHLDGEWLHASSLQELKDRLTKATAPAKKHVSIPFHYWARDGLKHGVAIGIHGANDNLLVRWDGDTKTEQMSGWYSRGEYLQLTDADVKKFGELEADLKRANEDMQRFVEKHSIKLREEVKAAIGKA